MSAQPSCRPTTWPTIAIMKEKQIDNPTRVAGTDGMERPCTYYLHSTMTVYQTYKGTREGSRMGDIQLANYQTDVGRDVGQP